MTKIFVKQMKLCFQLYIAPMDSIGLDSSS